MASRSASRAGPPGTWWRRSCTCISARTITWHRVWLRRLGPTPPTAAGWSASGQPPRAPSGNTAGAGSDAVADACRLLVMLNAPATIGELRRSEYRVAPIKSELRRNLIRKLTARDELFPGIIGYDDSVIPQMENAILAGQDLVLLGERGQAKSRLIRALVTLLDDAIPAVAGCEINDSP